MKVGFIQFAPERLEIGKNAAVLAEQIAGLSDALVVTPELALSGYLFRNREEFALAGMDPDDGRLDPLLEVVRENRLHLALGVPFVLLH